MPVMNQQGNVFLIGPMGAGKTTIGRHLATLLGKRFVDVDQEIEKRTGVAIPVIFEIEWACRRESAVIDGLRDQVIVLATGGGAVLMERIAGHSRTRYRGVSAGRNRNVDAPRPEPAAADRGPA
jgi:shikimate kinase